MNEEAPQREHSLREVFNALRWMVRSGAPWRMMAGNLPPLAHSLPAIAALDKSRRLRGYRQ